MIYEVGQKVCTPSQDEVRVDFNDGGFVLIVKYRSPNAKEKRALKSGTAQFKVSVIDGIVFFLSRFDTLPWMDAPYHRSLSKDLTAFVRPAQGTGYALHVMFIDAATGILLSQRLVGLSTELSSALFDAIACQEDMAMQEIYRKIDSISATYSTTDLVEMAEAAN